MSGRVMGGFACVVVVIDCVGRAVTGKNTVPFDPAQAWVWWLVAFFWGVSALACWFGSDRR